MIENYPFATIEPNVGIVPVPDERLPKLKGVVEETEGIEGVPIVPATVQFVDIAGLVKGASEGAGLGNKFLSHIREVDVICEVVRAFPDEEVVREGSTEPISDIDVINTELVLADLQVLAKQKIDGSTSPVKKRALEKLKTGMDKGMLASGVGLSEEEYEEIKELQLLTFKKIIYVLNVNTTTNWKGTMDTLAMLQANGYQTVVIDAKLEAELSALDPDEQVEYLGSLGIKESGLDQLIGLAYRTLGLISFLTAGEKEVRAWTIKRGTKAPQAAGVIHTDFEKGFIKAEVVDFPDFVDLGGWKNVREAGKVRLEGRDYEMRDGDVVEFKVNV